MNALFYHWSNREKFLLGGGLFILFIAASVGMYLWNKPAKADVPLPSVADSVAILKSDREQVGWTVQTDRTNNDTSSTVLEEKIVIDVKGEVQTPGVYSLKKDSRVQDAVKAARGPTEHADMTQVNMAEKLEDAVVVWIPHIHKKEAPPSNTVGLSDGYASGINLSSAPTGKERIQAKIHINQATLEELMEIPGIGEAKANAILTYRKEHGNFKLMEDLLDVKGIGPGILEKMKDRIVIP